MNVTISLESTRQPEEIEFVKAGMRRHTESCVPWEQYEELTIIARTVENQVAGAALGETGRGWLHTSVIWVDEPHRRSGLGRQLAEAAEAEARRRGCHSAYLDTFSYQARPFDEILGYEVFGTLDEYPVGHQRFFMRKCLRHERPLD